MSYVWRLQYLKVGSKSMFLPSQSLPAQDPWTDMSTHSVPIWTAFITHHVLSPKWLKKSPHPATIHMSDLKRHIFSQDYQPHVANSGAHVLDFDKTRGKFARL